MVKLCWECNKNVWHNNSNLTDSMAKEYGVRQAELRYEPEDGEDFSKILSLDTIWLLKA